MKTIQVVALGLLIWNCASCVFYSTPVKSTGHVNKNEAILYGRFYYGHHFAEEPSPTWYTKGLWLQNETADRTHYFELKESNAVYGVQVEPGTYRIMGLVGSDNEHWVKSRTAFLSTNRPAWLTKPFSVREGEQIYIGDYQGETKIDYPMLIFRLKYITNNFEATTVEFRKNYPALMTTPTASIFDRSFRER